MEKKKGETEAQYVAVLLFHNSSIHYLHIQFRAGAYPSCCGVGRWGPTWTPVHYRSLLAVKCATLMMHMVKRRKSSHILQSENLHC